MKRFGWAIRTGGDTEISGALAVGIAAGTTPEEAAPVSSEAVRRVDMRRRPPEEWAALIAEAQALYGEPERRFWPVEWLLVLWALVWYGIDRLQVKVLEGRG